MPSINVTPAQLAWVGGSVGTIPARFEITAVQMQWSGGFLVAGPGTGTSLTELDIGYLGRLRRDLPITEQGGPEALKLPNGLPGDAGKPTMQEQVRQRKYADAQDKVTAAIANQVNDNATLLAQIVEAQKQAQLASDTANAVQREQNLTNSRTDPIDTLSGASNGTVTIIAHNRIYGDGTSVPVNGGSVSGFSYGDFVRVSYPDAAREGGPVSYEGTTGDVLQTGNTHVIGGVTIPQDGEPPAGGSGPNPPGYIPDPAGLN